jgi:hypothetical protein
MTIEDKILNKSTAKGAYLLLDASPTNLNKNEIYQKQTDGRWAMKVEIIGVGSSYELPIASASVLGGIKVGSGLTIDATTGVLSATGGGGTVTSVAVALGATLSSVFSVSGSPITTSGTITLAASSQTQNLVYASPNGATGTPTFRALVAADIPSLSGTYVPYTGATGDVNLGTNDINAEGVKITGVAGNGHLTMRWQSVDPISAGNHTTLFADSVGNLKWKIDGGFYSNLITTGITANRAYTLQDGSGTLAFLSNIPSVTPRYKCYSYIRRYTCYCFITRSKFNVRLEWYISGK